MDEYMETFMGMWINTWIHVYMNGNHQVQIKKELTSELNLTLDNEIEKLNIKKLEAQVKSILIELEDLRNRTDVLNTSLQKY